MQNSIVGSYLCTVDWDLWIKFFQSAVPFGALVWGVRSFKKTKQKEIDLQKEHFKKSLNLKIYDEVSGHLCGATEKLTKLWGTVTYLPSMIIFFWDQKTTMGLNPKATQFDSDDINRISGEFSDSFCQFIVGIERYLIAFPELKLHKEQMVQEFRLYNDSLSSFLDQIRPYLSIALFEITKENEALLEQIEWSNKDGKLIYTKEIPQEKIELVKRLAEKTSDRCGLLVAYLNDIQISLQKLMLGDLFDATKLKYRLPEDPNQKVLSINGKI